MSSYRNRNCYHRLLNHLFDSIFVSERHSRPFLTRLSRNQPFTIIRNHKSGTSFRRSLVMIIPKMVDPTLVTFSLNLINLTWLSHLIFDSKILKSIWTISYQVLLLLMGIFWFSSQCYQDRSLYLFNVERKSPLKVATPDMLLSFLLLNHYCSLIVLFWQKLNISASSYVRRWF